MSYDVYVTRAEEGWSNIETFSPITLSEWLAYVAQDPEMRLDEFAEITIKDLESNQIITLRHEKEGIAVWLAYSKHGLNQNMAWFQWEEHGYISVKNPDNEILSKMQKIASVLGANVLDDAGSFIQTIS